MSSPFTTCGAEVMIGAAVVSQCMQEDLMQIWSDEMAAAAAWGDVEGAKSAGKLISDMMAARIAARAWSMAKGDLR